METLLDTLTSLFSKATQKAFPNALDLFQKEPIVITQSTQSQFGHYQMNAAMRWAKPLQQPPRAIAEAIVAQIDKNNVIALTEIAGPGFINVTVAPSYLEQFVTEMGKSSHLGMEQTSAKNRIIIDFSSPNIAKEMHVGHLRSTIIGDSLARLFEFLGHDVIRINHIGDWGTAFGMLIAYLKENEPRVLTGEKKTNLTHLVQWYKESKKKFDEDPVFKKTSQHEVVALQSGDPTARKAWEIICEISRKAYQEIYDLLDIHIIERGESFYNPYLNEIIDDFNKKGLLKESEGAKCLFLPGFTNREGNPLPLILQKSDGGFNYATTDMATIRHRIQEEKANHLIYVTDAGQATHFAMIFAAAETAGYLDHKKIQVNHVPFGLVLGPDGKKFRTRSGETERLLDLLTTAINKAETILQEKNPSLSPKERHSIAHAIGLGAIKYADLSCHRVSDYTFSYERMLRFEGNTAAFLLYAYVRVAGIQRKIGHAPKPETPLSLQHPSEQTLALTLAQFGEAIQQTSRELLPNRLTDYLYHLAEAFHAFYRDCPVEGSPEQESRLLLSTITARTLKQGLYILGLTTVERM